MSIAPEFSKFSLSFPQFSPSFPQATPAACALPARAHHRLSCTARVPPALQPNCQPCETVCAQRQLMETGSAPCVSLSLHAAHTRSFPDGARTTMHSHSRAAPTGTPAMLHRAQTQLPTRVRAQLPAPTRAPAD